MQSSPPLAFDAKAEKSRSLVTADATLLRGFGYQFGCCRLISTSAFLECCVCSSFAKVRRQISPNKDIKQLHVFVFFFKSKTTENTEASKISLQCLSRFSQSLYTSFVLAKLKRELFSSYEIS